MPRTPPGLRGRSSSDVGLRATWSARKCRRVRGSVRQLDRRAASASGEGRSTSRTRPRSPVRRSARSPAALPRTSSSRWTPPMPRRRPGAGRRSTDRANILNKIADRMEANLETARGRRDLGQRQAVRETLARRPAAGDRPLPLLRGCGPRAGGLASPQIDEDTVAYHFHEPLGVVGQIIPWNFPLLMASGSWPRRWRPATAWCSSRPSRRPRRSCCGST